MRSRNRINAIKGTRIQYVPVKKAFLPGVVSTRPSVWAPYADHMTQPIIKPSPTYSKLR